MGARTTDGVVPRRSKLRACLLLARVSNLPTVWTNVLAAYVISGAGFESMPIALLSMSLFYTGGMFLNDAFDLGVDRTARPDRPIPNGDVSQREAFMVGFGLLLLGEAILVLQPFPTLALRWGIALIIAIVFYDFSHKGQPHGPIIMGLCRALIYPLVVSSVTAGHSAALVPALVMWAYVLALTHIAKLANRGDLIPWLIAGISLVDAAFIAAAGGGPVLAATAVAGFIVTLALQRIVPGT